MCPLTTDRTVLKNSVIQCGERITSGRHCNRFWVGYSVEASSFSQSKSKVIIPLTTGKIMED